MNQLIEWIAKFFGHIDVTGTEAMAAKGLRALIVFLAAYVFSKMLQRKIARKIKSDDGESKKVIRAYNKYIHFFSMTVGFLLALYVMGANVSTIFHSGGLIAIAFAFVMKSFAENFLAGLTIRIDGLIKPGDILESNGEIVKVKELGIRGVVGITRDLFKGHRDP